MGTPERVSLLQPAKCLLFLSELYVHVREKPDEHRGPVTDLSFHVSEDLYRPVIVPADRMDEGSQETYPNGVFPQVVRGPSRGLERFDGLPRSAWVSP